MEKYRFGIRQRLGFYPKEIYKKRSGKRLIWIQAVSVGEALAIKPLLSGIRRRFPEYQLLISTTTLTGYKICNEKIAEKDDIVIFFPIDYYWTVKRSLRLFRPSLIMLVETEIWPNFINNAAKSGARVMLINGRISDKSYIRYLRFRRLMRRVLSRIIWFGMQSEKDAARIIQLGADSSKVITLPSLKYEGAAELAEKQFDKEAICKELLLTRDAPLVTGGSTHAGEEVALISAYLKIRQKLPKTCLLLAPRHQHRVGEIAEYLRRRDVEFNMRSKIIGENAVFKPVIILDTLGELTKFYAISTVVFIGKSLYGRGGQNPMEPAALDIPVIFGPYMSNFIEPSNLLLANEGAIRIENQDGLSKTIENILENPKKSNEMGLNAQKTILNMKGAVAKTLKLMEKILEN